MLDCKWLSRTVFEALFAPRVTPENERVDRARNKAKLAGVQVGFDTLWRAEQYRAAEMPGACATPEQILQIAMATYEKP